MRSFVNVADHNLVQHSCSLYDHLTRPTQPCETPMCSPFLLEATYVTHVQPTSSIGSPYGHYIAHMPSHFKIHLLKIYFLSNLIFKYNFPKFKFSKFHSQNKFSRFQFSKIPSSKMSKSLMDKMHVTFMNSVAYN